MDKQRTLSSQAFHRRDGTGTNRERREKTRKGIFSELFFRVFGVFRGYRPLEDTDKVPGCVK